MKNSYYSIGEDSHSSFFCFCMFLCKSFWHGYFPMDSLGAVFSSRNSKHRPWTFILWNFCRHSSHSVCFLPVRQLYLRLLLLLYWIVTTFSVFCLPTFQTTTSLFSLSQKQHFTILPYLTFPFFNNDDDNNFSGVTSVDVIGNNNKNSSLLFILIDITIFLTWRFDLTNEYSSLHNRQSRILSFFLILLFLTILMTSLLSPEWLPNPFVTMNQWLSSRRMWTRSSCLWDQSKGRRRETSSWDQPAWTEVSSNHDPPSKHSPTISWVFCTFLCRQHLLCSVSDDWSRCPCCCVSCQWTNGNNDNDGEWTDGCR
jgi:hypothetical protein